jgi:hypothetical protein
MHAAGWLLHQQKMCVAGVGTLCARPEQRVRVNREVDVVLNRRTPVSEGWRVYVVGHVGEFIRFRR